jgi:hypothetical protein
MHGKAQALVVLPEGAMPDGTSGIPPQHRHWLARSRLARLPQNEPLLQALVALDVTPPAAGLGALRLLGQTGQRPAGWVAAADPVCLDARLDHVVLRPPSAGTLAEMELSEIFKYLQRTLAAEGSPEFACVGTLGYLRCNEPMATAAASPAVAAGDSPERFMPAGELARAHDRLQSEIQLCLHEADANKRRGQAGMSPVNALWLWGGGVLPEVQTEVRNALPPLFTDDPLFKGYWLSASAPVAGWPGSLDACLQASPRGFVAVLPGGPHEDAAAAMQLSGLRRLLRPGRLNAVTLILAGGLRVEARRWDALRFWRRNARLPVETAT